MLVQHAPAATIRAGDDYGRSPQPSQHRHDLRHRRIRRAPLYRHGVSRGRNAGSHDRSRRYAASEDFRHRLVKGVRVYTDTDHDLLAYEAIDAIALHGTTTPPFLAAGGSFDILGALPLSGTFDTVNLPTLSPALDWQSDYIHDSLFTDYVRLSVVAVEALPGDFYGDGDIDLFDLVLFQDCASGPAVLHGIGCEGRGFDNDNDVDLWDFAIFQRCFSGEGVPDNPTCGD